MKPAVKRIYSLSTIFALVVVIACDGSPDNSRILALAQEVPPPVTADAVLFRITDREVRFYTFPGLADAGWNLPKRSLDVEAPVGFAPSTQQFFVLSEDSVLSAIDLAGGLIRVIDSSISMATIGPNGVPYVVGKSGFVGTIGQRQVSIWADSVAQQSTRIWGALGGRMLTETDNGESRTLRMFSGGRAPTSITTPQGPMAVSRWAELVAIATPSSIALFGTRGEEHSPATIEVLEGPKDVIFSASGHRIYVTTNDGMLLSFDRYSGTRTNSFNIGSTGPMRVGSLGRYLFIRDSDLDTAHIFDIRREELVGKLPTSWTTYSPSVAPDGTILLRQGDDMVSIHPDTFSEIGRVAGNPEDIWVTAAWTPVQPVSQRQDDEEEFVEEIGDLYVQVSSSQNETWATDLATRLNRAGMEARVLSPEGKEELFRVVLGPFGTREAAESSGRRLGRPYWIFTQVESLDAR
jgi:hypothetical protein